MRLTSSGLANALSSGLAGFLSSGQQFTRASQALLENTVNAINGGPGPEELTLENGASSPSGSQSSNSSVVMGAGLVDRINQLELGESDAPEMSMETAAVEMIKAGTTYNASARIVKSATSMLDALFRAVA